MTKKGDTVFYLDGSSRHIIQALVLVAHRDGSAKIKSQFIVYDGGKTSTYLGYVYDGVTVYPNAMSADNARQRIKRVA